MTRRLQCSHVKPGGAQCGRSAGEGGACRVHAAGYVARERAPRGFPSMEKRRAAQAEMAAAGITASSPPVSAGEAANLRSLDAAASARFDDGLRFSDCPADHAQRQGEREICRYCGHPLPVSAQEESTASAGTSGDALHHVEAVDATPKPKRKPRAKPISAGEAANLRSLDVPACGDCGMCSLCDAVLAYEDDALAPRTSAQPHDAVAAPQAAAPLAAASASAARKERP